MSRASCALPYQSLFSKLTFNDETKNYNNKDNLNNDENKMIAIYLISSKSYGVSW